MVLTTIRLYENNNYNNLDIMTGNDSSFYIVIRIDASGYILMAFQCQMRKDAWERNHRVNTIEVVLELFTCSLYVWVIIKEVRVVLWNSC